ncbi:MAG: hypothetical protein NTZ93_04255 [Candidatus Beckwithbacteria bacterium]|nr:hypothetical protein [Candidatus Beckwithbacteria bacterium]
MSRLLKKFLFVFIFSLIFFQPVFAQSSPSYLTDYLETDVFLKLAPQNIQDRYKNAMIMRAGPNPDPQTITNLYGFTPATIQIHDYQVGSLKLSQLQPKPLDDPQALAAWQQSPTAQVWPDVPMFTREDTKGFIEAPSGEVHDVIHPHLARTYEVSSALSLLTPYQKEPKPIANSNPSIAKFITGEGDIAKDSSFVTTVTNAINSPVTFKTYTPFLKEIAANLIGLSGGGIFNLFNSGQAFSTDISALGRSQQNIPNQSKFYYLFLGSIYCAQQKVQSFLQPFTGQTTAINPLCQTQPANIGSCDGTAFALLNPPSTTTAEAQSYFTNYILSHLTADLIDIYSQASAETEVPCEILAAIHFREGDNNPNLSLISGRPLGTPEPDAGNQVFQTLLETAIYAGNELKHKINNNLTTMDKLVTALYRYNGTGNANCRLSYGCNLANHSTVPACPVANCCNLACRQSCAQSYNHTVNDFVYPIPAVGFCPGQFEGEDSPYPVNMYDNRHLQMYILYCLDGTMCPPQLDTRPGTATVSVEFYNYNK